jgi:4-carboxymuconolactone decarboxylase
MFENSSNRLRRNEVLKCNVRILVSTLFPLNGCKIHTRGAIANGVTPDQIREVLLHTMVYVGVPRAVDAFNAARETLLDMGYEV